MNIAENNSIIAIDNTDNTDDIDIDKELDYDKITEWINNTNFATVDFYKLR